MVKETRFRQIRQIHDHVNQLVISFASPRVVFCRYQNKQIKKTKIFIFLYKSIIGYIIKQIINFDTFSEWITMTR